jgi:hypothetical protein
MIKFTSDLLQVDGFHDKVSYYRLVVVMVKLASYLLQIGAFHDKVGQ